MPGASRTSSYLIGKLELESFLGRRPTVLMFLAITLVMRFKVTKLWSSLRGGGGTLLGGFRARGICR
jgi:hypothetical protein